MTSWDLTSAFVDTEVWCCHACGRQMFYNPAPRPLASKLSWERCPNCGKLHGGKTDRCPHCGFRKQW